LIRLEQYHHEKHHNDNLPRLRSVGIQAACPSCGAPQKGATNTGTRVVVRTVALLAAILAALVAWSSYNVDSTAAASNAAVWGGISGLSLFAFVRLLRA
jgi:hypothetical protein